MGIEVITPEIVVTPVELEGRKYRKEYQLTDEDGKDIGPPQVFEADSPTELADKLATAHINSSRKIAQLKKQIKPDEDSPSYEFKPRALTADEKWKIKTQLEDPTTIDEALDTILEARYGAPVSKVVEVLQGASQTAKRNKEEAESRAFLTAHAKDYHACPENETAILEAMKSRNLAWTKRNLEIVFEDVQDKLVPKPSTQSTVPDPAEPDEAITSESPVPVERVRGATSTGLMSRHSTASTVPAKKADELFAEEVRKMPQAEYKRRITTDIKFRDRVNKLGA